MRWALARCSTAAVLLAVPLAGAARAASLQTNIAYGSTGAVMNVYVPDNVDPLPAIVVTLHYCNGHATDAAQWFTALSDQYGFIVIAPGLPSSDGDGCWDVGSQQTLTHNGGSHSKAVAQMVAYAVTKYGADATRVFAAGASSGAMFTNVLLGSYPDVFAAGAVLAGVPFGCWKVADGWDSACSGGQVTMSSSAWGNLVRNAYPGYTGKRPRVELFHGNADTTLNFTNLGEEVKQWTNVLGLSETPSSTLPNTWKSGWTRTIYGTGTPTQLEVNVGQGVDHDVPGANPWQEVIKFFGLDQDPMPAAGSGGMGAGGAASGAGGRAGGGMNAGGRSAGGTSAGGMSAGGGGMTAGGMSSGGAGTSAGGGPGGASAASGAGGIQGASGGGGAPSAGSPGAGGSSGAAGRAPTAGAGQASFAGAAGTAGRSNGGAAGHVAAAGSSAELIDPGFAAPSDNGCGCRVGSRQSSSWLLTLVALGAFVTVRRKRH